MNLRIRPIELEDLESLGPLDVAYAAAQAQAALLSGASLRFFARTGHSFVAEHGVGELVGFVLAQALWDGVRPAVRVTRLVAVDELVRAALAEALVKSAYDAAVYSLLAEVPPRDTALQALLARNHWQLQPMVRFERTLGSRAGDYAGG